MNNTPTTIEAMSDAWLEAKAQEHAATERRRVIEDAMLESLKSAISEDGEGALPNLLHQFAWFLSRSEKAGNLRGVLVFAHVNAY